MMASELNAILKGSWVFVTGANGYIASQVINTLLELGYKVRGSVRSPKPWLEDFFTKKFGAGAFETVLLENFEHVDKISSAMKGASGVVHMASDLTYSDNPEAVIPWVVQAIQNVLTAAGRNSSVRRVVLTSSSTAVLTPVANREGVVVDENTWNEAAVKAAWDPNTPSIERGYATYAASKTRGEQVAWEWVNEHKPSFVFNSVLPNFNTGERLHSEIGGSTMGWVRGLLQGDQKIFDRFPPQYYVDVGDTARLHAISLLAPDVTSQRIFAFAGSINLTDIIHTLRELRPHNMIIPDPPVGEGRDLTDVRPAKKAKELLRRFFDQDGWSPLRESLAAGIQDL